MNAVDTNVIVRVVADDDPEQDAAARALFASESIWISKLAIFETAWVLKGFGFDEPAICNAITRLQGFDNVQIEDANAVTAAIALCAQGLQLSDALLLTARPPGSTFITFDKSLVKRAKRAGVDDVEHP
jgi:predicted nucleic-acid-binding protein